MGLSGQHTSAPGSIHVVPPILRVLDLFLTPPPPPLKITSVILFFLRDFI